MEESWKDEIKFVEAFYSYERRDKDGLTITCYLGSIGYPIDTYDEDAIVTNLAKEGDKLLRFCPFIDGGVFRFHMEATQKGDKLEVEVSIT